MMIDWQKVANLLPVIVQCSDTNDVLMLGYMNQEALNLSMQTGFAHYFSRTKNRIWKKGEESGNLQKINSMHLDCDNDTLLIKVTQIGGVACHTGQKSCFFKEIDCALNAVKSSQSANLAKPNYGVIDEIYHTILDRKLNADATNSYVASLFKKGENSILKKIGEEASELIMACKDLSSQSKDGVDLAKFKHEVVYEAADLCFHALIALAMCSIHPDQIKSELARRNGISGIAEKNSRNE